jgi:hypothetical protein
MILEDVLKMESFGEAEIKFLKENMGQLDQKTKVKFGFVTEVVEKKETVVEKVKKAVKKK